MCSDLVLWSLEFAHILWASLTFPKSYYKFFPAYKQRSAEETITQSLHVGINMGGPLKDFVWESQVQGAQSWKEYNTLMHVKT
jgi:hypothetical protein